MSAISTKSDHLTRVIAALLTTQRGSWEQGVAAQALLEYDQSYPSTSTILPAPPIDIMCYLYGMANEACVRASTDGRLCTRINSNDEGSGDGSALDPACIVQTMWVVMEKLKETGDSALPTMLDAVEKMVDYMTFAAPRMEIGSEIRRELLYLSPQTTYVLSHIQSHVSPQLWIDGVYMGPPSLASTAIFSPSETHRAKLLELALDQVFVYFHFLRLPSHLIGHVYDCNTRSLFLADKPGIYGGDPWGVGNGWAVGGIVRILNTIDNAIRDLRVDTRWLEEWIDQDQKTKNSRIGRAHQLLLRTLDAILSHHSPDMAGGLFYNVIDDPQTFVETNLAQMVSATLYRLLYLHLPHSRIFKHLPRLDSAWQVRAARKAEDLRNAAVGRVDSWGFVRGVCASPRFDRPGTSSDGQAWAILMEVARADYIKGREKAMR